MLSKLVQFFSDPEDNDPRFSILIRNIIISAIIGNALVLLLVSGVLTPGFNQTAVAALSITLVLEIISLLLALSGRPLFAKVFIPTGLLIAIATIAMTTNGLRDTSIQAIPVIIIISVLLNRKKSIYFFTPIAIIVLVVIAYVDQNGIIDKTKVITTGVDDAVILGVLLLASSFVLQLMMSRLEQSLLESRANEQIQKETNQQLTELQSSLEKRVEDRTAALATANITNERRANQFQAVSQVARAIASLEDINNLLPNITRVISNRFSFYHVGIFLLDDAKQYAVLSAANSEGGLRMLANGHRLRVGEVGIVGYTASTGIPRIALDTGADAAYFNNPDLPETHSEIALPLQISNKLIGVLDVQSTEPNAFSQEDVELLNTLSDQVSIAIRNAQLYRQSQASLSDSQMFMGNYLIETWKSASQSDTGTGYRFVGTVPTPLQHLVDSPEVRKAVTEGRMVSSAEGKNNTLAVPIKIRDEVIGVLNINAPSGREWDMDELDIVQAAVQRTSLALENYALLEETQRRASKERIISDISTKISSMLDIDNLLQTTIQEMARAIPGSEVAIQLQSDNSK